MTEDFRALIFSERYTLHCRGASRVFFFMRVPPHPIRASERAANFPNFLDDLRTVSARLRSAKKKKNKKKEKRIARSLHLAIVRPQRSERVPPELTLSCVCGKRYLIQRMLLFILFFFLSNAAITLGSTDASSLPRASLTCYDEENDGDRV